MSSRHRHSEVKDEDVTSAGQCLPVCPHLKFQNTITKGVFDYRMRIRIHNESESEVHPTRHAHSSKVIRFAK